jgi:hypothetical protein
VWAAVGAGATHSSARAPGGRSGQRAECQRVESAAPAKREPFDMAVVLCLEQSLTGKARTATEVRPAAYCATNPDSPLFSSSETENPPTESVAAKRFLASAPRHDQVPERR